MNSIVDELLMKLPLASTAFLAYALVGAAMLISGTLDYDTYSSNLLAVGIACGAIGVPRALSKRANGIVSANFLGFIESLPIPTIVFGVFLIASSVDLIIGGIVFSEFTSNLEEVGIACGLVQAARTAESIFGAPRMIVGEPLKTATPTPPPPPPVQAVPPPAQ